MYFDVAQREFKEESQGGEKIAFVASDGELSWYELKDLCNRIGNAFEKAGVQKGARVLLFGEKEKLFLAGLLACYRSRLTFIPVSPLLPAKRIESMVQQSEAEVMLACSDFKELPKLPVIIQPDLSVKSTGTYKQRTFDEDAYILFTSGSTGSPKGVRITPENVSAFVKHLVEGFQLDQKTVFINRADLSFDISLADLFGALQTGGTAIFNTATHVSEDVFFERINKYKGTWWNSTPSFVISLLPHKKFNAGSLPSIKTFVLSGESLTPGLAKEIRARFPQAKIINAYGPTETCIFVSHAEITDDMLQDTKLPIAKFPSAYLALENDEIIISGKQVGPGYLNNDALTAGKFAGGKFLSGDLGEARNGLLYYNGRTDYQIKLNGYRIELEEIKSALEKLPAITQAECLPIEINGVVKRIVAFVLTKDALNSYEIKRNLLETLPSYQVPSEIIFVKEFPVTASLKTDRKKLLADFFSA